MKVLISGASVAGPALAYWLRKRGFTPTVVERAPAPRPGGQAIDLRGAARDAAERMGIVADVRAAHTGVQGMAYVDSAGKHVARMGQEQFGHSGGIIAELEILRGDLVRIIYDRTRDDVEYIFDDSVTELAQGDDGVKVAFRRSEPRKFDLVVGADGLHSKVRALAFGPESAYATDVGYHLAIFPAPAGRDLDGWQEMYGMPAGNGVHGRMAGLYPTRDPQAARAMFFFAGPPSPVTRSSVEEQKRLVADVFAGEGWEVPRLVRAMWEAADFYFDRATKVTVDGWSRGRAVLLGDSVFGGSVGMGTSMALVGAYVLAGELAAAGGDHQVAFARYEQEMRAYVTACLKPMPGGTRGFLPRTRRGLWLRNMSMRGLVHMPWKGMIVGGIEKTANAITLKDY